MSVLGYSNGFRYASVMRPSKKKAKAKVEEKKKKKKKGKKRSRRERKEEQQEEEGEGEGEEEEGGAAACCCSLCLCKSTAGVESQPSGVGFDRNFIVRRWVAGGWAAMEFSWKMLVGPAMLVFMKVMKIDYDAPNNLLIIRILYALSQLALFAALFAIYQRINQEGDEKKTVKVKVASPT
jgi:hypothetical protein